MPWGVNGVRAAYSRLLAAMGVGSAHPGLPKISIGEGFYAQAIITAEAIDRVDRAFRDFTEPLTRSLREVILPSIRENFDSEGRPPWERLAESTVERRQSAHPILYQSGTLRDVATDPQTWKVTQDTVSPEGIDSKLEYAKYIQGGTRLMPARPFLVLQDEDGEKIQEIFGRWVDEQIRIKGGFK